MTLENNEIEAARTTTSSLAKEKEPPGFKQGLGFSFSSENAPLKARFCLPCRHLFSPPERERSSENNRSKEGGRDTDTDREVKLEREINGRVVHSMLIESYDNLVCFFPFSRGSMFSALIGIRKLSSSAYGRFNFLYDI